VRVEYQHIEDNTAAKITTWNGKYINMTGRTALVKLVLASQALPFDTTTCPTEGNRQYGKS
jgi:hypothetical protein